jgi:hypothetical protein
MSAEQPSRLQRIKDYVDPRVKHVGLQYIHFVATTSLGLVSGLILAFLFAFGVFTAGHAAVNWVQRVNQARAQTHIRGGVYISPKRVYIAPATGGSRLPTTGAIYFKYFMGTTDQNWVLSCSAEGAAKTVSYEYNRAHHTHITISPRQIYDIETGGNTGPSGTGIYTSISDYNRIIANDGAVPTSILNYGPNQRPASIAQWAVESVPAYAQHGRQILSHPSYLWKYQGAGLAAVQRAREAIAGHRPVAIGSDWYYNAEKSSWYTGKMGLPVRGDWVAYAHTVVLTRYNDHITMPDGTTGAFLASNSAGKLYGRDKYGNIHRGLGGYVWISYAYVERYAANGTVEDLGLAKAGGSNNPKDRPAVNPNAPTHAAPFDPGPQTGGAYSPYVHGVILRDTGYDITNLINYWVSFYHRNGVYEVSGPGIVAIGLTESSLNQYAPRCCIPGDTSYSTFQFTLGTACAYGVCSNIEANLNNPVISTRLVAEYVDHVYHSHPAVPFPNAYVFFNAGEGVSDSFAWNPSGVAYSNFLNFLGNWNTSLAYYMGGSPVAAPPPAPKKVAQIFHVKSWCRSYIAWKIKGCPSAYWHGHLGAVPRFWAFTKGLSTRAGGVTGHEVWHPKRRYMSQTFSHAVIYSWPTKKGSRPKVVLR